jgi:trehalose/maltose transport system substrate-binding protein
MRRRSRVAPAADGARFCLKIRKAAGILVLAVMAVSGCRKPTQEPVTLGYFRLGWFAQPDEFSTAAPLLQQFTQKTGVRLNSIPVPESTLDQLELSRKMLKGQGSGPDVLGVDLIWSGALGADLLDLRPYLAPEISSLAPQLMRSYTGDGRVVAIPYGVQTGVLEYRTDLLREYGYDHPPKTWDELEKMALRIQTGERAKGKTDFWGYVWQGAAAEALTCNALEWQASEGGGRIIEDDSTISVNNPAAIRSWQRAKRWIGWISPPSVVAYRESDSMNVFDSGGAAFDRVWGGTTITNAPGTPSRLLHLRDSLTLSRTGYTRMPAGAAGSVGTLGGSGLAVSRNSAHVQEAVELVRFLIRAEVRSEQQELATGPPGPLKFYDLPSISGPDEHLKGPGTSAVSRPSNVAGMMYEQVTRAYIEGVHSVLTGHKSASEAAADVGEQLVKITGFRTGPPRKTE